jgi:hypothetical protein
VVIADLLLAGAVLAAIFRAAITEVNPCLAAGRLDSPIGGC